jgi:hypothetical protein
MVSAEKIAQKRMSLRVSNARKAISAETYGEYNKKEAFVARVIPKNEEQTNRHIRYIT